MNDVLWRPTAARREASNMTAFLQFVENRAGVSFCDDTALWQWSVSEREKFWAAIWDFCGVRASRRWDEVLRDGDRMPGARWFCGARLNYAENLLQGDDALRGGVGFRDERGPRLRWVVAWSGQAAEHRSGHPRRLVQEVMHGLGVDEVKLGPSDDRLGGAGREHLQRGGGRVGGESVHAAPRRRRRRSRSVRPPQIPNRSPWVTA